MNGLLPQLAPLLALSASSPFWRGEPTGLMSSRQMVFSSFPRSGPPPRFRDYADYAEVVGQLERTGCIADYTHIWWDIRLHPRLGTIEIRICDAVTRVEDAVAITAYCQALVKQLSERFDAGEEIPTYHRILTTENKWLAARYGLEAPVMDLATGRRNRIPIAKLVRRTLKEIEPHARELGSERELEGIAGILARGNSADRQLRIFNANRDIIEVVEEIATATELLAVAGVSALATAGGRTLLTWRLPRSIVASRPDAGLAQHERAPVGADLKPHRADRVPDPRPGKVEAEGFAARRVERVDERRAVRLCVERVRPRPVALHARVIGEPRISSSGSRLSTIGAAERLAGDGLIARTL